MTKTDNEIFGHYIFMDNKFTMPTASGLPLTFALSGTFTLGAKGGLDMSRNRVYFLYLFLFLFSSICEFSIAAVLYLFHDFAT